MPGHVTPGAGAETVGTMALKTTAKRPKGKETVSVTGTETVIVCPGITSVPVAMAFTVIPPGTIDDEGAPYFNTFVLPPSRSITSRTGMAVPPTHIPHDKKSDVLPEEEGVEFEEFPCTKDTRPTAINKGPRSTVPSRAPPHLVAPFPPKHVIDSTA